MSSDGDPTKCWIWQTPAKVTQQGDNYDVVSARAGGKYRMTGTAAAMLNATWFDVGVKVKLTDWLVSQRRMGDAVPTITSDTLNLVQSAPGLGILERRDRALEFLAERAPTIGANVRLSGTHDEEMRRTEHSLCAASGSAELQEAHFLLRFLREDGLIETEPHRLTFKGWQYLEDLRTKHIASFQAFVAMWFDASTAEAYAKGIEPAIRACGYSSMRIDKKEHINKFDDEIIAEIRRSRFLVADFTSEPEKPRGGVYFEAGFAMGLRIPVIWTCRSDLIDKVHSDTRQFNHIVWSNPEELFKLLKNRIGAVLGDGPLPRA